MFRLPPRFLQSPSHHDRTAQLLPPDHEHIFQQRGSQVVKFHHIYRFSSRLSHAKSTNSPEIARACDGETRGDCETE